MIVALRDVSRSFPGVKRILALRDVDLVVDEGEFVAIVGPSGSGKSTLLNLLSGLDLPDSGSIRVAGYDLGSLSEDQLTLWRASYVGFIFQFYNLIPVLRAVENVELPLLLKGLSKREQRERAMRALRLVGLEERAASYPRQLSGGEQQRVAIARAVVSDPPILLADEPTGDLDAESATEVLEMLRYLVDHRGKTVIMVTHDSRARACADRVVRLDKGLLESEPPTLSIVG